MSTMGERADDGSLEGLSGRQLADAKAAVELAAGLVRIARDEHGELSGDGEVLKALREDGGLDDLFVRVFSSLCPEDVNRKLWVEWLQGGKGPYEPPKVRKKKETTVRPSVAKTRASGRVTEMESKVREAKAELEVAERRVAKVERELLAVKNVERAELLWHVDRHFGNHLAPVFAMGPAWTIMRSLSSRLPEEVLESETEFMTPKEVERAVVKLKQKREDETSLMMETLDFLSGDIKFEEDVRSALVEVCKKHEKRFEDAKKEGRRRRSQANQSSTVNPRAVDGFDEVLDGLRKLD